MNKLTCLGLIPDGNRRWAKEHSLSLPAAYLVGAHCVRRVIDWALEARVEHVVAFASSGENVRKRPAAEVLAMHQATAHFCRMVAADSRVRVQLFGAVARISVDRGRAELEPFICANRSRTCLTVHLAVNYDASHAPSDIPPVDLVIRTGDRHRLSHFVVSRCGDAELLFLQKLWPDFDRFDWDHALAWFASRERTQGE